jgi:hypothetical protein
VCLNTILSLSSMDNSFNLMTWFLLWHALSTVGPYIDRSGMDVLAWMVGATITHLVQHIVIDSFMNHLVIVCWSDQSHSMLKYCFIRKCIGDIVPTVTIKTFPNQKLWIDGSIPAKLKARTTTFNHGKATGNVTEYKQCSYSLCKAIKQVSV